jgi:hypothetical protein
MISFHLYNWIVVNLQIFFCCYQIRLQRLLYEGRDEPLSLHYQQLKSYVITTLFVLFRSFHTFIILRNKFVLCIVVIIFKTKIVSRKKIIEKSQKFQLLKAEHNNNLFKNQCQPTAPN